MQLLSTLISVGLLASVAVSHPGPHGIASRAEVERRSQLSRRCASAVAGMNEKRYLKRNLERRNFLDFKHGGHEDHGDHGDHGDHEGHKDHEDHEGYGGHGSHYQEPPYYSAIQNDTCVLSPETTAGPYLYHPHQVLRKNIREGQAGIPFTLDIGVIDMKTCEPLDNALVDIWHCNATGAYSSFTGIDPNIPVQESFAALNITVEKVLAGGDYHTDEETFLRGMWPTDDEGVMEIETIVPGFYVGRSLHIHVQVHTEWEVRKNGTVKTGKVASTGQLYFSEEEAELLMAEEPYVSHTEIQRITNDVDYIYATGATGGYNPIIDLVPEDGHSLTNGVIGYITIGVDTDAVSRETRF